MSNVQKAISKFIIANRLTDPATNFNLDFKTALSPKRYITGDDISFSLGKVQSQAGYQVFKGQVQNIKRDRKAANQIYALSGRDLGLYFVKQPFIWPATLSYDEYPFETILINILNYTGAKLGKGLSLGSNPMMTTRGDETNSFSGEFKTKKEALDVLFDLYRSLEGLGKIRWHIDMAGNLNWFEVNSPKNERLKINENTPDIVSDTVTENAENIVNQLSGYGCDSSTINATLQSEDSINRFGLQIGDNISDSNYTTVAMVQEKLKEELDQKAWPIYSGQIIFSKYIDIQPGTQIILEDDPDYSDILFTVVDTKIEGSLANQSSTINFMSSDSAMSIVNDYEMIQSMINQSVRRLIPRKGVVVEKEVSTGYVLVRPYGSNSTIFAKGA